MLVNSAIILSDPPLTTKKEIIEKQIVFIYFIFRSIERKRK